MVSFAIVVRIDLFSHAKQNNSGCKIGGRQIKTSSGTNKGSWSWTRVCNLGVGNLGVCKLGVCNWRYKLQSRFGGPVAAMEPCNYIFAAVQVPEYHLGTRLALNCDAVNHVVSKTESKVSKDPPCLTCSFGSSDCRRSLQRDLRRDPCD